MIVLQDIPFRLDAAEVFRRLHLDAQGQYAGEVNVLIDAAGQLARPRAAYIIALVEERDGDGGVVLRQVGRESEPPQGKALGAPIKRTRFTSKVLGVHLDKVEMVFPYVASCGRELDSIPVDSGDVFGQFCRDVIKEMALWSGIAHLYEHLQRQYGLGTLASMNPGTGGTDVWPVEQQKELFAFLGNVEKAVGVVLTDTCLMVPNKSVSGVFYPSEDGFQNCHLCRQKRCPDRHAPFDRHRWEAIFGEAPP